MCLGNAVPIQKIQQVVRKACDGKLAVPARRPSVPARIECKDMKVLFEKGDLMDKIFMALAIAVQQHQRKALARFFKVHLKRHAFFHTLSDRMDNKKEKKTF